MDGEAWVFLTVENMCFGFFSLIANREVHSNTLPPLAIWFLQVVADQVVLVQFYWFYMTMLSKHISLFHFLP